jgi:hypothetical protein
MALLPKGEDKYTGNFQSGLLVLRLGVTLFIEPCVQSIFQI